MQDPQKEKNTFTKKKKRVTNAVRIKLGMPASREVHKFEIIMLILAAYIAWLGLSAKLCTVCDLDTDPALPYKSH